MTSATPSTAAASRSSRARTPPRSPSGTSAGSLIDPASPRDAQSRTTRAPASASRASVPPHASDSSSGCAKMPRTVRPASESLSGTVRLHDAAVHADVFVDHARDAEARNGALADAPAIEIEHAREGVRHVLEVVEYHPGDSLIHDLADGAAIQRRHRRSARHRLAEHEAERFGRLNRV